MHTLPLKHYLARMDKIQFYKEKTAPGQEFLLFYFSTFLLSYFSNFLLFYFSTFLLFYFSTFLLFYLSTFLLFYFSTFLLFLATLAKLANSTILQEYVYIHTPHLHSIWPGWPTYSSTRKKLPKDRYNAIAKLSKIAIV
jgi:hypothetical protein